MATLTIRDVDDDLKSRLRIEAAVHGQSMEEEVRSILRRALGNRPKVAGLGSQIHRRFAAVGGAELQLPERDEKPHAADLPE